MDMAQEGVRPATPPYISFRTLLTMVERLESGGIPQRIDRSFWGQFLAGGLGAQTITAMKWLGLLQGDYNEPTDLLEQLVKEKDKRKELLAHILRQRYAPIFDSVDLARATPHHLDGEFRRHYKAEGDTLRKVVAFFIHAAQYAGISVSTLLTKKTRKRGPTTKTAARPAGKRNQGEAPSSGSPPPYMEAEPEDEEPPPGDEMTIRLRNGGSVTVSLSVSLVRLRGEDRRFVFELLDKLHEYEETIAGGDAPHPEAPSTPQGTGEPQ